MRFKLLAALILFATNAIAATFGDTEYVATETLSQGCGTYGLIVNMPVNVSVNSRIHVSARATVSDPTAQQVVVAVVLKDSTPTQVATSEQAAINIATAGQAQFVDADGLLHEGFSSTDPASPAYVAVPGSYTLTMEATISGATCAPTLTNITLTYILLSSAFDDIFADGFQAMLDGNGSSVAMVA
jgi:hypothetical protein